MKVLLRRVKNVVNDRVTRVLFYDQTLKKGYASLASFSKLFILRRLFVTLVAYPLSLICWVFLVVLNRFKPVRMYRFERPQRPGFASVYIEQLEPLCRELQDSGHKGFLIFIDASETTNMELLKLYATHFNLYLDDRLAFLRTVFARVPRIGFTNTFIKHSLYDTNWELPPAINLKTEDKTVTPKIISQLNLEPFKFVILTHRSFAYDFARRPSASSELNRNTDIGKAIDAIKLIQENGLRMVRMGVDTDVLPNSLRQLPIIDLSGEFRTDEQDLWLSANCLFLWGVNDNGAWHLAHRFNRPTLVSNNYSMIRGYQHTLFATQLIWDERKNRHLRLNEMATLRGVSGRVSSMKARGLTYVEQTPSELVSYVAEMLSYVNNKLEYANHDLSLLSQWIEVLFKSGYPLVLKSHSRPCISFLRDHQDVIF